MGCGSSSEAEGRENARRPMNIGPPQDLLLNIPRPRFDERGVPLRIEDYELDRETMYNALSLVAEHLSRRNEHMTVIAVGGAVNVLLLQSRQSTHDVDCVGTNIDNRQRRLLDEAAQYAESRSPVPLGGEWLNNQAMLWLAPDIHRLITDTALEQNDIVFEQRGLKIVAAPWSYAFCTKLSRLTKDTQRPYDLSDAVSYLHHYIERQGGPVKLKTIQQWTNSFKTEFNKDILRAINQEYQKRYRQAGIA